MSSDHNRNGFDSDAAFFDIVAQQTVNRQDRKDLRQIAATYRGLAKTRSASANRSDHWKRRAAECRALAEKFKNEVCRKHLNRLAETYEMLAYTNGSEADALQATRR